MTNAENKTERIIRQLSVNFKLAIESGEYQLAAKINDKINQLIEYTTSIKP